ncbi:MAG: hypothetical protein WA539_01115, partial [Candidatus Sulfotelmatobacter sp.]
MGRLRCGKWARIVVTISSLLLLMLFLPACGGRKPPGASPFPVRITLNPSISASMQLGTTMQLTASAQNVVNSTVPETYTFVSSNPGILDVTPNGLACAGTWNAPAYTICTPAGVGVAEVTASALGATSASTLFFVHAPISAIQVSILPPVNSPPPACPAQIALPAACNLPFRATNSCLSQNQVETLQATAYDRQGTDITASVGPFTWSQSNANVATLTPLMTSSYDVVTNQVTASPSTPGQTQVIASASGVFSAAYNFETCPVQCIALYLSPNGQYTGRTSFVANKGTSETVAATAVDVQGCIVPKPPLTWISSEPAALAAGNGTTGCSGATTCNIVTNQPGVAAITASCTPPSCNVGFPLNLGGVPAPYAPQPVYPVTAISGLVTGAPTATNVLVSSQDCYSNPLCTVGLYNVATSSNLPGGASELPAPPNSLLLDPAGDKAYMGSEFGAIEVNPAEIGTSTTPFTSLPAPGTTLGSVTGKVLAVSYNGGMAIFSDTVSTPNQVYVVATSTSSTTTPLNINSATAAAFSPDGLEAFILGNAGNNLYVYSSLQSLLPPISLPAPATSIVFSSTGSFALLSGGSSPSTLAVYSTCNNSAVSLPITGAGLPTPPMFLRMVPAGNIIMGTATIPNLETTGLDFFFGVDNTGIDIIATTSSAGPLTTLCPQIVTLAQTTQNTAFEPTHIDIGQGTFHPINFFLSPDATMAYIVASDRSSVLVYDFNTNSVSAIQLVNNATPVAADMTVDGTLIYVAGSDGLLHELNTALAVDLYQTSFAPLPN